MTEINRSKRQLFKSIAIIAVTATFTLTGCASSGSATPTVAKAMASGEAATAISAAKAALKKAGSVGGKWNETGKMIKKAEALAKDNKSAAAIKLAKAAEMQGKAGFEQAKAQIGAGPRF